MNCWSITTTELKDSDKYDHHQCWVMCDLRRNDTIMLRRVVTLDIVAEVIPAMQMIGQGMAVLEINPRLPKPIDLPDERNDTLFDLLADKFGAAPTTEFICKTVDAILDRAGIHTRDQHPSPGEGQQSNQSRQTVPDTNEQNARTDPHTEGTKPRGDKTCGPD